MRSKIMIPKKKIDIKMMLFVFRLHYFLLTKLLNFFCIVL